MPVDCKSFLSSVHFTPGGTVRFRRWGHARPSSSFETSCTTVEQPCACGIPESGKPGGPARACTQLSTFNSVPIVGIASLAG